MIYENESFLANFNFHKNLGEKTMIPSQKHPYLQNLFPHLLTKTKI